MDRSEYLVALRQYLFQNGMSTEDIEEAMSFYGDFIMDSTPEEYQRLGSPSELGSKILAENGTFTGSPGSFQMEAAFVGGQNRQDQYYNNAADDQARRNKMLLLIILLVTIPVWGGVAFGLVAAAFGIIVGLGAAVLGLGAAGIALLIEGIRDLFTVPPVGLALTGAGFLLFGLCGVIFVPLIRLVIRFVKWAASTVSSALNNLLSGVRA
ncbi:MAG: hypothetical protein IJM87_04460 [Ruminococcus sp.]|nr:hypothetical protein [Ruminococcus sp.]